MSGPAEKAFHVSWDRFHQDARALAWRLAERPRFAAVVAITRGGLVPAAIIARELNLRILETISIASYDADNRQGALDVLKPVAPAIAAAGGDGILVVDDLVDTGATMQLVRAVLPKAHVATVYAKPQGLPFVDSFMTEVSQDTWIYFPWDLGLAFQAPIAEGR